ncbi:divergent polysaccharide deacetylase family protein [Thalassomonas viridans]|uniref:Divergent polysaccharide deacetylase family protein n=1 Tax=Thalassomonas viridans TaxID=137584 RepID=A0AAF0C991_9GAMM|nr:divergent polysaccharide deacetylase family protein [Thalassomonas viridans]WDE04995.1 divergent polysaccharide deacetylase family protein [Thalassomonas viridans]
MILRFCFLSLFFFAASTAAENRIAIVIDDIGYRQTDSLALDLPGDITYSILPQTPYGKTLALQAYRQNKEILLHIPMESENGKRLGPGALTRKMSEEKIRASLKRSFEEIPFAIGINNHMGSLLTQLYRPMSWIMAFLKERDLLFLDSLTTEYSRGREIARDFDVPALNRHVFLDNQLSDDYIASQFQELIMRAKTYQSAIAIAHPHPETITALTNLLPTLAEHNISLVPLSALLPQQYSARAKVKSGKAAKAD